MEIVYGPYLDPDIELLIERMNPPRVCIDNDSNPDCTLVKVDSANKNGILLEMVQVLTDVDLVISKSYISSDGGWLMDVFHVTDQWGNKITDENLVRYIQKAISESRENCGMDKTLIGNDSRPRHGSAEHTTIEMTGIDRPGVMSEISAVLAELGCYVSGAVLWTHNTRAACIIYVEDGLETRGPIKDPCRMAYVQSQLETVVEAYHNKGERRILSFADGGTHTERRLHQLMEADRDFEACFSCCQNETDGDQKVAGMMKRKKTTTCKGGTHVKIENCEERAYSVVHVRSRDRPKLLFDTLCALTDMQYVVFHAAIRSEGSIAIQEYYMRHKDGCTLETEAERERVTQCLVAATERRVSHGVRVDITTGNRIGLLSDVTRLFRENGLSITRADIGTCGDKAVGTFYVKDVSGQSVSSETLETIQREIGDTVVVVNKSSHWLPPPVPSSTSTATAIPHHNNGNGGMKEGRPKFSLGTLFWSQLERLSSSFRLIKS